MNREIFVFGSNLAGRHGKGAALFARQNHGAVYGQGWGLQGNSYGIPTKDERIRTLPLVLIQEHVRDFLQFAAMHPELAFNVTKIGCGLAGYTEEQIAPMFKGAPINCNLPEGWRVIAERHPLAKSQLNQGPHIVHMTLSQVDPSDLLGFPKPT